MQSSVDMIVYRSKNTRDTSFVCSKYPNSRYGMVLPEYELNDDNAMEFLEYYKKPVVRARELKMRTIAIEAVTLENDDMTFSFAVALKDLLEQITGMYELSVFIVGNKEICNIYELAFFGEVKGPQVIITDILESNEVIVIPTKKKMMKWYKPYKSIQREESLGFFFKYNFGSKLIPGKYCLANGKKFATFYYLVNFDKKSMTFEDYQNNIIMSIKAVLGAMEFFKCNNITIPMLRFIRNEDKNRKLLESMLETICAFAEDKEINIKLYCPEIEIVDFVQCWFED